jgi:hypothetical protein
MRTIGGGLLLLLLSACAAFAQVPSGNIFLGYSYLSADTVNSSGPSSLNGWEASLEGKVFPLVGVVADFSAGYGTYHRSPVAIFCPTTGCPTFPTKEKVNTYLFGPRISFSVHNVRPFAEALMGAAHMDEPVGTVTRSDTSFATAVGGGADFKLLPIIGWRVQADWLSRSFLGSRRNDVRVSTGVIVHF